LDFLEHPLGPALHECLYDRVEVGARGLEERRTERQFPGPIAVVGEFQDHAVVGDHAPGEPETAGHPRVRVVRPGRDVVPDEGHADVMELTAVRFDHGPEAVPADQDHVGFLAGMLYDPGLEQ
jgi:hypothetical protein